MTVASRLNDRFQIQQLGPLLEHTKSSVFLGAVGCPICPPDVSPGGCLWALCLTFQSLAGVPDTLCI